MAAALSIRQVPDNALRVMPIERFLFYSSGLRLFHHPLPAASFLLPLIVLFY
jgi:hypothetical protein